MNEIRFALRVLRKSPGFTAIALFALALGIGANTAIFTVVDGILLRPLPYPHPDRIVVLDRLYRGNIIGGGISAPKARFWKENSRSFDAVAAVDFFGSGANLAGDRETERYSSGRVSSDFFRVLGVEPAVGRFFTADEDRAGAPCVAVITSGLWHGRFGGDPAIAGRAFTMSGVPCTITGVLPANFQYRLNADIFTPMRIDGAPRGSENAYVMIARLKPDVSLSAARAELQTVFARFAAENPDLVEQGEIGIYIARYLDAIVGDVRGSLWILMGAVGLVLLIACANVANLLLSRAAGRAREIAVRSALGASRGQLVRQLLIESVMLAIAGGGCGILLAYWSVPALLRFAPGNLPRAAEIAVDARVAMFALLLSVLTGIVFGVVPALRSSGVALTEPLREGRAGSSAPRARSRSLLIAAEVALSVVLLAGAGLLIRSFVALRGVSLGYETHNILAFRTSPGPKYATTAPLWEFERRALEQLRALPGVDAAATTMSVPLEPWPDFNAEIPGPAQPISFEPKYLSVSPDFFRAFGVAVHRGRAFSDRDTHSSTPVAMINETLARRFFQDRNPIGELIAVTQPVKDFPRVIVGVVGDMRESIPANPADVTIFIPRSQVPDSVTELLNHVLPMSFVVRARVPSAQLIEAIRKTVLSVDPQQPLSAARAMDQVAAAGVARQQFNVMLMGIFAAIAMLLAAVGIYGVVSYQVGQRTREIGVRTALGATHGDILRLVIGQGMMPVAGGIVAGFVAALALTRLMQSLLYEVSPRDPVTMIAIPLLLAAAAGAACYFPARRASRIDPMTALRQD